MMTITERTRDIMFNVFTFVLCVVVVLAVYAADLSSFVQPPQLHLNDVTPMSSIVSSVAALAHLVGVCVCVLYIITFSLLLVVQFCPSPMPARYVKAGFYKARRWVLATYASWQQRRRRARRVRFVPGDITKVIWIASHRSYTMEERLGMFSSGEMLRAMQRRNNIEHAYEHSLGRVPEEDEFYLASCGRRWHPAHARHGMMIQSLPRLIHPVRPSAKPVAAVVTVVDVSNDKADDFNDSSSKCSTTRSTSHDEPLAKIGLSEDCSSDNDEDSSLLVGTCGTSAGGGDFGDGDIGDGDADVPLRTDGGSNSNCSTSMTHDDEPLVNVDLMEDCSSDDEDSSSVGSCGSSSAVSNNDAPRTDGDSNSNCSTSMTHDDEPLVNVDFIENYCSSDDEDSSSVGSCGSSSAASNNDAPRTDGDSNSNCSTSMTHDDEPLVNVDLMEDCSSDDEDSSAVGSCGSSSAGSGGDGDVPVPTEPPPCTTTEAPSSTVPCAQPSQRYRTRPFLARKAKEGLKRYVFRWRYQR